MNRFIARNLPHCQCIRQRLRTGEAALRAAEGHVLVELSMITVLLVIVAVLCANVGIMSLASSMNDSACRDAARAAAQASSRTAALNQAQAALKAHKTDGYFVSQPTINTSDFVYEDYSGSPPDNTSPYVQVTTSSTVRVPAPILFFGAQFGKDGTMTFNRTYTFPIVRTQLYLN